MFQKSLFSEVYWSSVSTVAKTIFLNVFFLTLLALSRRSGKLLISGGNVRFDVVFHCGFAAEPVQRDKHAHNVHRLLFKDQHEIQDSFFL